MNSANGALKCRGQRGETIMLRSSLQISPFLS